MRAPVCSRVECNYLKEPDFTIRAARRALTVPVDVEGGRELFGGDAGQSALLRRLQRHSFCGLRLPTSVAHPERHRGKHFTGYFM